MATVKYSIRTKTNPASIYIRFSTGRNADIKIKTPLKVNPKYWNVKLQEVSYTKAYQKQELDWNQKENELNSNLNRLQTDVKNAFIEDNNKGIVVDKYWLRKRVSLSLGLISNEPKSSNIDLLSNYAEHFISNELPYKDVDGTDKLGVSESTIRKYKSIRNKLIKYENWAGKTLRLTDVDLKFRKSFISYLKDVEHHNPNTIGRYIKFVKTICMNAKQNGHNTHIELGQIKGFTREAKKIILIADEIKRIYEYDFLSSNYLDNARDWLVIGLNTGLRVSDLLRLTQRNIKDGFIEIKTQKTNKLIVVPIHSQVNTILNKRDGNFPRKISDQRFNDYIKEVGKSVGLNDEIEGAKMNPETKRKEEGIYPKWQLISSHVCRRSFATNHYGELKTHVIMGITGHSTEKMFLTYIGKTAKDNAEILRDYWNKQAND